MNIVVCIKQVPDVPNIRIDHDRMTVIREGVDNIINPLDQLAIEAALALRRREGGEVTVLTMGPPQSEEALREALAAGADRAVLITDPAFAGGDTLATSRVIGAAIAKLVPFPDVVMCGLQTMDSDTGHVGPQIAEELDLPQVWGVNEILFEGGWFTLKRVSDGFLETVRVQPPVVLCVAQGIATTTHLPLGALETAFSRADVQRWGLDDVGLAKAEVGFSGSATQVWRLRPVPPRRKGEVVTGPAEALVARLIRKLESLSLLNEEDGNS
jgi:electron transfer flavoprotein alpha/beta subunit